MIRSILARLLEAPPLPRRMTFAAWEKVWQNGMAWGATLASFGWLALIVFALVVAEFYRRGR